MALMCPRCNLSNPDDAGRCGCGCPLGEATAPVASSYGAATGPAKLPKPLGDPLRTFRRVVSFFLVLEIGFLVISLPSILLGAFDLDAARGAFLLVLGLSLLGLSGAAPFTLWLWSILPGRAVNAFYLRSFRNDPATWPC